MEFKFKVQKYQTDAVDNIVKVFEGQEYIDSFKYRFDKGKVVQRKLNDSDIDAYGNAPILLSEKDLLRNINSIQKHNGIKISKSLDNSLGTCSLDIEMETGTGKTYVYTKSMFELNKYYGWCKFIIVVPSIAIREGVKKSFETTQNHFMEQYKKKIRFYVYNSSSLYDLDTYSQQADISALIINSQAFASSLKEGANNEASKIIYSERDDYGSRRPIDVIAANNPILILDEPQKLGGDATQKALKNNFNTLFSMNFSATHSVEHNKIYILDALDAYNKKLVKKIEVKGIKSDGIGGVGKYLYLEDIVLSKNKPPRTRMEIEVKRATGNPIRKTVLLDEKDSIYAASNELEEYRGLLVVDIKVSEFKSSVVLSDGTEMIVGEVIGDVSEDNLRRIQMREALSSHFEKEALLFPQNIKCLTLFFIDSVSKYRAYDENGDRILGEYGKIFEEEYDRYLIEHITMYESNSDYANYLKGIRVKDTHNGYFSIDKKTKRAIDSTENKKEGGSDDTDAYDLIMKNKELLLSFKEPTRFIFSHSALREGWDNPNIFQICALKHSDNTTYRRQEVGRGLRICVDQDGNRKDSESCGDSVHEINKLTVVASEGYDTFVKGLQEDTLKYISDRPVKADVDYFKGKTLIIETGEFYIDKDIANTIHFYLARKKFVDEEGNITDLCRNAIAGEAVLPDVPEKLIPIVKPLTELVRAVSENRDPTSLYTDGRKPKIKNNKLNENFSKKEFQELWKRINNQYVYFVEFDSEELIRKSIASIDSELSVTKMTYTVKTGVQNDTISRNDLDNDNFFSAKNSQSGEFSDARSTVPHDLVGEIAKSCIVTRKTVVEILKGIENKKYDMYKQNPEEFIRKVAELIRAQKASLTVEHISYSKLDKKFDSDIFTMSKPVAEFEKAFEAKKHIQDYVFTDGVAEKSVERRFAEALDIADEVVVYAKLPRSFYIPTPMGNYSPDWAIAFKDGSVKHVYFIAETKGSMNSLQLRKIEDVKISCAEKLFNQMSTSEVKYHKVDSYEELLKIVRDE